MERHSLLLAAALMKMAAEEFSNHGCNDMTDRILSILTPEEWDQLSKEYHTWNGDPEEFKPGRMIHNDSAWMSFFAHKLEEMADKI